MGARRKPWPTAQLAAAALDITSAEVCRLLNLGRLAGTKQIVSGGIGKAQWFVDPKSIVREKRHRAKRAALLRSRRRKLVKIAGNGK